jgi:hypothetical protein
MTILDASGKPSDGSELGAQCDHGVTFDEAAARKLLADWVPDSPAAFIAGPPGAAEVRKRWPRLMGACPKGCGYHGIAYASSTHYVFGDW